MRDPAVRVLERDVFPPRTGILLDPLGGLAKNLLVLPALAVLWVVSERR